MVPFDPLVGEFRVYYAGSSAYAGAGGPNVSGSLKLLASSIFFEGSACLRGWITCGFRCSRPIRILSGPAEPSPLHKFPLHEPRFLCFPVWRPALLLIERR
jgi:hypothetical protein